MKNKKLSTKILSFIMTFLVLAISLPIYAFASAIDTKAENEETIEETINSAQAISNELYVLEEDATLREENAKHFKLSDGTMKAASYAQAVHYKDENGNWIDIDNSLTLSGSEYATSNKQEIKFANKSGSNGLISIKDGEYKIDFTPLNTNKVDVEIENPEENNSRKFDDVKKLNKLISKATYKDIYSGIDLEYILVGNNIKENIIIKEKQSEYSFSFEIKLNKLNAELENNVVVLTDSKTGEKVYEIPAPYMLDANGEYSDSVEYILTKDSKWKYTLTVVADPSWINAEEREFPVKIDPTVIVNSGRTDTFVYYDGDDYSNLSYMKVGMFAGQQDVMAFIKFATLPEIPDGSILAKSELAVFSSNVITDPDVNFYVAAYLAKGDWVSDEITYIDRDNYYDDTYYNNAVLVDTSGVYTWDITEIYQLWMNDTENQGVCLKAYNLSSGADANLHIDTDYIDANGNLIQNYVPPQLEVTYVDIIGVENYYGYLENTLGDVGKSYVNLYNSSLTYINHLTSIEVGENLTYDINMVYNSIDKAWTPSFNESITKIEYNIYDNSEENDKRDDVYYWKDPDGTSHAFTIYMEKNYWGEYVPYNIDTGNLTPTWEPDDTFYPEDNIDYVLIKTENDEYILRDYDGNQKMFDATGRLSKICDAQGNMVHFSYKNGNLYSIDYVGIDNAQIMQTIFIFNSENELSVVYNLVTNLQIFLTWDDNGLSKIEYNDIDGASDNVVEISYIDSSNMIDKISDNTESTYIKYDSNTSAKITSVWFYDNNGAPQSRYNIYRGEQYIVYTDHGTDLNSMTDNVRERFTFDEKGRKTTQSESTGSSGSFTLIDSWTYNDSLIPDNSYHYVAYSNNINNELNFFGNDDVILRHDMGTKQTELLSFDDMFDLSSATGTIMNMMENISTEDNTLSANDFTIENEGSDVAMPLGIIDGDNRQHIADEDVSQEPYNSICLLKLLENGIPKRGTGFLIGPNVMLTAAHNVYTDRNNDGVNNFIDEIVVYVAAQTASNNVDPCSSYNDVNVEECYLLQSYCDLAGLDGVDKYNYDWAICILNTDIGNQVGWFDISITPDNIVNNQISILGYPDDKSGNEAFDMFRSTGIVQSVIQNIIIHEADTVSGNSGSPVFVANDNSYTVKGIHTAGGTTINGATKITLLTYTIAMILRVNE